MARQFNSIDPTQRAFIERQKMFFAASAAASGRVNLSPKGLDTLRVLDPNTVAYLDFTGSGNETAAHLRECGRLTLMFCAFVNPPLILRLYGKGRVVPRLAPEYAHLLAAEFGGDQPAGARQMIVLDVDLVQTSCGFGVPLLDFVAERSALVQWSEKKGELGLETYRREKNARSIDGFPTGIQ